ncbi:hypothetical protein PIB30_114990, partial [Stylosanthes scabra]|nr:hypothetical protein [Stylosanthes scabra]
MNGEMRTPFSALSYLKICKSWRKLLSFRLSQMFGMALMSPSWRNRFRCGSGELPHSAETVRLFLGQFIYSK